MPRVLIPRAQAAAHEVQKDQTLKQIFEEKSQPSGITWEEFAVYNFGTTETRALNRALVELVGCSTIDADDAAKSVLDPALKPKNGTFALLLPEVWAPSPLAPRQEHIFKIRRRLAPPGVTITHLDPWFLPKKEACDLTYALDGSAALADKASVSVYASNYCSAEVADDGAITYPSSADLPSEVIWSKGLDGQAAPREEAYAVTGWKGESLATKGALKKRGEARYINVACSPYTAVVRFYKDAADKDARLLLAPFWPLFEEGGAVITSSLVVRWSIEGTSRTMEHGQLRITDKTGAVVLRRALAAGAILAGELAWAEGEGVVEKAKMPYRAELEVHTGADEANGVALAAMHTEVRLWVHPGVKHDPKKRTADPQCLDFEVAPHLPAGVVASEGTDLWHGLRLADLGYHPGPVDGDLGTTEAKMALRELQRSYPKNTKAPFQRLAVTGAKDVDTTGLLEGTRVTARARFGEISDENTQLPADLGDQAAAARCNDKDHASGLILWVDDLHYYTEGPIPAGCDPQIGLGNYRGGMDLADDGKVTRDQQSICRPWIPLAVHPRLLSKGDDLTRDTAPAWDADVAECVGPLRVDWAFTEASADVKPIVKMQAKLGVSDDKRVRTLATAKHIITKKAIVGDDGQRYPNCPKKHGGLRPDKKSELGDYYKDLFGIGGKRLAPWKAVDDGATKIVCSAAHDDLGQAEEELFAGSRGRAGVYFRPSIIAGDGYRLRAEVSFAKYPGEGDHPNRATLAGRYQARPVGHTCQLRVWRRTAVRGHVKWTRAHVDVALTAAGAFDHYRACHVHMTHSKIVPFIRSAGGKGLVDTDDDAFQDMIIGTLSKSPYNDKTKLAFQADYAWPWSADAHLGIQEIPPPGDNLAFGDYREKFLENVFKDTWDHCRGPMLTHLLDRFEKAYGLYRGHLTVGFAASPDYYVQAYLCSTARHRNVIIETKSTGGTAEGEDCRATSCDGKLAKGYKADYRCAACNTDYLDRRVLDTDPVPLCETQCAGLMTPDLHHIDARHPATVTYRCTVCDRREVLQDQYFVIPAYVCGTYCGDNDHPTPLTLVRRVLDISASKGALPLPAVGSALGACFVFEGNDVRNWAHEMGHHRHMEHAAGAPGEKVKQHDSEDNPHLSTLADAKPEEKRWDRCCVMGYSEKLFFCGKCVLKNRGWKVEDLPLPPEDTNGL